MNIATHQPIFLAWPGLFFKAARADCLVLLDAVQFPRGRSWMTRNRLKNARGELWLTVPVHRRPGVLQTIRDVEIFSGINWRRKHVRSVEQWYANAPFLEDYLPVIRQIYGRGQEKLFQLNLELIQAFWEVFASGTDLVLQSQLGVIGRGTTLIADLCDHLGARRYITLRPAAKFLDATLLEQRGIRLQPVPFHAPVYPQLWGEFLANLSAWDLVLNCGPRSREILLY